MNFVTCFQLNVMNEWLNILASYVGEWGVQGSNLSLETIWPHWGFSWFSLVHLGNCWDSTLKVSHIHFLPNPFQFIIHLSPFHWILYSLIYEKRH
jgi:hypothetical protein